MNQKKVKILPLSILIISVLCFLSVGYWIYQKRVRNVILQKTVASTAFLKDIINDALDMSKIESGQLEPICRNIDLNGLLSEVETLLETQARHKQIDFTVNTQGIKQKWIAGDPIRIKQILMKILGNAIKFTPEGGGQNRGGLFLWTISLMIEEVGLDEFIPEQDTIAHWSTEDFNTVFAGLKESITDETTYVFMMYALNSQGDSHIMTLLQAMGGSLYDENGNLHV